MNQHNHLQINGTHILIDGKMQSDLDWKDAKSKASKYVEEGHSLFWDIDLGLFNRLSLPLSNQTQFHSLALALEHFRDTLWTEFQAHTSGVCVYQGHGDFSCDFPWDEEQIENLHKFLAEKKISKDPHILSLFCRDVCVEYINLLVSCLPDSMPLHLLFDMEGVQNPLWQAQLLTKERFERIQLSVKGAVIPLSFSHEDSHIGICFPSMKLYKQKFYEGLDEAFRWLLSKQIPFRIIPESLLITEWDGLDYLLYAPSGLTPEGRRKLLGFCAAGGTVVSVGELLGLPEEISFAKLQEKN
jgi:hypothetical protein